MARKRMISPEILSSSDLAGASMRLRLGFIAVLLYVDDEGRGQDDAALLRAHAWPRDSVTVRQMEADLAEMTQRTVICRYEIDGKRYLHAPKWHLWQKVQHPTPSRIPICPKTHETLTNISRETREAFTPSVGKGNSDQISAVQVRVSAGDLTSRSADLTAAYLALNPLAEKYPTQRIVAKAIGEGGYTDDQVRQALTRLAHDKRPLTSNTLYVEINGQPKTSTTNSRVAAALDLADKFADLEAPIPQQRAIGGRP